ncbi:MAG: DUF1634 domain-containing protein [Bacteroidota bacterium]|jgi:uncharacterized membrane protein
MPDIKFISNDTHHAAERWTSRILRLGVWISASLMIFGLLIATISPSSIVTLSTNPSLSNLVMRMLSGSFDPVTLMLAGLVFLMFTPILRVITAIFGFAMERDWRFVIVSSIVLLLLAGEIMYSIILKG